MEVIYSPPLICLVSNAAQVPFDRGGVEIRPVMEFHALSQAVGDGLLAGSISQDVASMGMTFPSASRLMSCSRQPKRGALPPRISFG